MSKKDLRYLEYRVGNEDFWTTDSTGIPTFDWSVATGARGDYYSGESSYGVSNKKLNWTQRALAKLGFGK